jgi:hypothetical protein
MGQGAERPQGQRVFHQVVHRGVPIIDNKWHAAGVTSDVIIVGARVAGLLCAKVLASAGKKVRVVERSRGVGGRCATRRIDGQSVDHGLAFLHGKSPEFLAALREVPGRWRDEWPIVVRGTGTPCQLSAFVHGAHRMAHASGVSAFPKHLALGLGVVLETTVTGLALGDHGITVRADQQNETISFTGQDVVLALAGPQSLALLDGRPPLPARETARAVLAMMPSVPCATVIALYPRNVPAPPWDIWYPETLKSLDVRSVRVMTNNPNKLEQLKGYGVTVAGRVPHVLPPNEHNRFYLETKAKRSGHMINFGAEPLLPEQSDTGIPPGTAG